MRDKDRYRTVSTLQGASRTRVVGASHPWTDRLGVIMNQKNPVEKQITTSSSRKHVEAGFGLLEKRVDIRGDQVDGLSESSKFISKGYSK